MVHIDKIKKWLFFNKVLQFVRILTLHVNIKNVSWESITCLKKLNIQSKSFDRIMLTCKTKVW